MTCARATDDCRSLFTSSKDGSIARWDMSSFLQPELVGPEASTSKSPIIVKTDFLPKRPAGNKSKGKAKSSAAKGKSAMPRNHQSQDETVKGHTDEVYTLSVSADGKRLASGGKDRKVGIWDISSTERGKGCHWLQGLRGHRDTIASVQFRDGTSQVYTSSFDRTVKVYDAASLAYVETLFGHQDKIHDISLLRNELAVTAGGRDKTIRYWKVRDETQLVFRGGVTSKIRRMLEGGIDESESKPRTNGSDTMQNFVEGSVDCTAMIDDQHFLSGGDSGTISLWNIGKKKPIFTKGVAHGLDDPHPDAKEASPTPRWIVSLACLPYSDLFVSGSWDGQLRLWKISEDLRSFSLLGSIPARGFVNSLQILQSPASRMRAGKKAVADQGRKGVLIVAALAQEHKFGRWAKLREASNTSLVCMLEQKVQS